ncbi:PDZ domain-containing protein GIPC2 [Plecturocebus cupreus]
MCHHARLVFVFSVEREFYPVAQVGLELLGSSDLPVLLSQSAEITGMSHCPGLKIGPRSKAGKSSEEKIGCGRGTLRLRSKGPATLEEVPSETKAKAIEKIDDVLELYMGIRDIDLETRYCYVAQAGLKLLVSCDLPASISLVAEIAGMSHHAQLEYFYIWE